MNEELYSINVRYRNRETGRDIPELDVITVLAYSREEAVGLAQNHLDRFPLYPRYLLEGRIA